MNLSINHNLKSISDETIVNTFANLKVINNWVTNPDSHWGWEYPKTMRSEDEIDNKIYAALAKMSKSKK